MAKPRDLFAAKAFVDKLIGFTTICEEASEPTQPIIRAHLEAVLGSKIGGNGFSLGPSEAAELAEYLRGVADLIDPPGAA